MGVLGVGGIEYLWIWGCNGLVWGAFLWNLTGLGTHESAFWAKRGAETTRICSVLVRVKRGVNNSGSSGGADKRSGGVDNIGEGMGDGTHFRGW